jgi:hypothetical protein
VHGFVKVFDGDGDGTTGRIVYGSPGETSVNYQHPHPYAQFLRNAVVWARGESACAPSNPSWIAGNGNWETAANWSTNAEPGVCSDVSIPDQIIETTITIQNGSDININLLEVGLNVAFSIPLGTTFSVLVH